MTVARVVPFTATFRDAQAADKVFGFHRVTERAVATGYIERHLADRWLTALAAGPFFTSVTMFLVVARQGATQP